MGACALLRGFTFFFLESSSLRLIFESPVSAPAACSLALSATSQQYFSLRTNQPPTTSQQYFSLRTNQHQPSATSQTNRPLVSVSLVHVGSENARTLWSVGLA
jgi:hypothetical protein